MGAPKQKWTPEEEAALKAGIQKYGIGKWSTILKDPEFSTDLRSRSNVDLKDKWRNLKFMANGLGSRHRARVSIKSSQLVIKQDEDTTTRSMVVHKDMEVIGVTSIAASNELSQDVIFKKNIPRMGDVILETITKLKEPRGSSRAAIMQYVEENYSVPADHERTLAAHLKILTENGQLTKVKNQYRIAPKLVSFCALEEPKLLLLENGATKNTFQAERSSDVVLLSKAKIDAELEEMRSMCTKEAAVAAARAVAKAEALMAEAEVATREAEEAEAEAEAAQCFADTLAKELNCQAIRV
ncbi:single myb histone 6-like [Salvia splendens]|uniref:single myb histone 6-like n=1 Tax=Salvia splendens TaxID=180675 RepID=UPI001C2648C8|nr:single myb histone 6-like [Salvia splendens]XP_042021899.1 single myb histone 6-like [Salvia splendens]